ncbi:MAG TPA: class I tRNA ligase family protein, partial [bacterium]|nr:class I tRNA ligase family protein [bacterium]
ATRKELGGRKPFVVIWTTTPWTLPANLAIAMHPELKYVFVEPDQSRAQRAGLAGTGEPASAKGEAWLLAEGLLEAFAKDTKAFEFGNQKILATVDPTKLENRNARHPFLDRASKLVLADYVTLEQGTGCVHTAPGHGADDFATGRRYKLETLVPVNDRGVLTQDAGPFAGQFIFKANDAIIEHLRASGHLVAHKVYNHDYPHCWRCKKPVIFRATTQWFISMEKNQLRQDALAEIERTTWIPSWGRDRIQGMIASRPDWCISRQRKWGVPIIAFRCVACGETHTTEAIVERVAKRFETEGADAWYAHSAAELLGATEKCPKCGKTEWKQEDDILDVWFESGVSWAAVCEPNPNLGFPVDLYLEGSDQHRGWFHSTLLAAVGTRGKNAYRQCLTHGWVVDGKGEKLSKSKGNYIALDKVMEQSGADILRLWVSASDYREDVRLSNEIMERIKESYFKIRNTARFVLGNLHDFDPAKDRVAVEGMREIDRWLLHRTAAMIETMRRAYEAYEFHVVYREAVNFCTVDVSAFYAAALKDRLYCDGRSSPERRSAQTALFEALSALSRVLAPVLAYTAEEIWGALPAWPAKEKTVHAAAFPAAGAGWKNDALAERWAKFLDVRGIVLKRLEEYRAANKALFAMREEISKKKDAASEDEKSRLAQLSRELIGNADEASATVVAPKDLAAMIEEHRESLREAMGVSVLLVESSPSAKEVTATVAHAPGAECARCRRWYASLKGDVCTRCAAVVAA